MDVIIDYMDNFSIHIAPYHRQFPSRLPVASIGYAKEKKEWIDHTFNTFNFSIILSGGGSFRFRGKTYPVEAPCVITQWPEEHMSYGPTETWKTWEELYIIYNVNVFKELQRSGLAIESKPIWPIRQSAGTIEHVELLFDLILRKNESGIADRIDRETERLILESRFGEDRPPLGPEEEAIKKIRSHVKSHFKEAIDFNGLSLKHGLSPSTFRRYWARHVNTTPAHYVTQLRIREACRLLVDTTLRISEIAVNIGYEDALYFSRKFHQETGTTPSIYRKQFRIYLLQSPSTLNMTSRHASMKRS